MKSIILLMLILLSGSTLSYGQIQSADSNHVIVDKLELKYIINVYNNFNALKEINKQLTLKNAVLERIILDKDKLILAKEQDTELLKQTIDEISPPWYDKFLIGFGSAVVVIVTILLTVK